MLSSVGRCEIILLTSGPNKSRRRSRFVVAARGPLGTDDLRAVGAHRTLSSLPLSLLAAFSILNTLAVPNLQLLPLCQFSANHTPQSPETEPLYFLSASFSTATFSPQLDICPVIRSHHQLCRLCLTVPTARDRVSGLPRSLSLRITPSKYEERVPSMISPSYFFLIVSLSMPLGVRPGLLGTENSDPKPLFFLACKIEPCRCSVC